MIFRAFRLNVNEVNAYVVGCEHECAAMLIDVGDFDPRIVDFIEEQGLRLASIFLTHDHYDHVDGLADALAHFDAEVHSGAGKAGGAKARQAVHGDTIRVGQLEGRVLATPGHTPTSLSLAFPGMVFTGDALFAGSVGGIPSPQAAARQLSGIRTHILTLPDEYGIYPGHGPASTVAIERRHNPFFV